MKFSQRRQEHICHRERLPPTSEYTIRSRRNRDTKWGVQSWWAKCRENIKVFVYSQIELHSFSPIFLMARETSKIGLNKPPLPNSSRNRSTTPSCLFVVFGKLIGPIVEQDIIQAEVLIHGPLLLPYLMYGSDKVW